MDYRAALRFLALNGPGAEYNARALSDMMIWSQKTAERPDYMAERMFSVKRISGDLDRLYKMGFLTRRRIKRMVYPKCSPQVYRGFTYVYKISKQGWQYLDYLHDLGNPKEKEKPADGRELFLNPLADDVHSRWPDVAADKIEEGLFLHHFEDRGRHKRFPSGKYRKLANALEDCSRRLDRERREVERLKKMLNQKQQLN
jgi:hypothetical protein